jgi:hypothetical protein
VSIPVIAPTDVVYPGCPTPPTTFGHVWVFDPVNGQTQANGGDGSAAHPFKDLQALFGTTSAGSPAPTPGYTTMLLSAAPHSIYGAGPIVPGDEILLMSGNYGDIAGGGLSQAAAEIINNPAITIAAAPGQTPVISTILLDSFTGLVLNGLTVRSHLTPSKPNPLVLIQDGSTPGFVNTNIVLMNMTVQSDTVANALTWTPDQWPTTARDGILIRGSNDGAGLTCASVVNSHVSVTHRWGGAAITVGANNSLVQNNEVDHFGDSGIIYDASNVAVLSNNIHDDLWTGTGDSGDAHTAIEGQVGGGAPGDNAKESNIYISGNTVVEAIDPLLAGTVPQSIEGIAQYNGDWTNYVATWNRMATSGCWAIAAGNTHNGIIANNYSIDGLIAAGEPGCNPEISAVQSHENTCCIAGVPPTNIVLYNNVGPSFGYGGVGVTANHNVSTGTTNRPAYSYLDASGNTVNEVATLGAITSAAALSGASNIKDGLAVQTNEFAGVPAPGSSPMAPAPNWTLVANSPAATNQTTAAPPTYPAPSAVWSLPAGVSIPTIAPTDVVYPGCPAPPTTFGHVWTIDPVNGHTPAAYAAMTPPIPMPAPGTGPTPSTQGSAAHPWDSLLALVGAKISGTLQPLPGYPTDLLSTAPGWRAAGGPIMPGDEVLLNTGDYGEIAMGGLSSALSEIINVPAVTISAAPGQTPHLSALNLYGVTGLVVKGLKVQSQSATGVPLVLVADAAVAGSTNSNIVFENMDISSDTVANGLAAAPTTTTDTTTPWKTEMRPGVEFSGSSGGVGMTCVSMTNSHIYVTHEQGGGAVQLFANSSLFMNNEIDHFANDAIDYGASNLAIVHNNMHDVVQVNDGDHLDAIQGSLPNGGEAPEVNIYIAYNWIENQPDPALPLPAYLQGIDAFDGDWTNVVVVNNEIQTSSCWGIVEGSVHNGIIANNSVIDGLVAVDEPGCVPEVQVDNSHEGAPANNVRIFNNIAPNFGYWGAGVTADHNVATTITQAQFVYADAAGNNVFEGPALGQVTPASALSGVGNVKDGMTPAGSYEFVAIPVAGSFPSAPLANFTLLPNAPARTAGTALGAPPTDFNGAPFVNQGGVIPAGAVK